MVFERSAPFSLDPVSSDIKIKYCSHLRIMNAGPEDCSDLEQLLEATEQSRKLVWMYLMKYV